jgi:hypothetical protein
MGHWNWGVVVIFWVAVLMLTLYIQNMLLGIVLDAYTTAKQDLGGIDRWFIKVGLLAATIVSAACFNKLSPSMLFILPSAKHTSPPQHPSAHCCQACRRITHHAPSLLCHRHLTCIPSSTWNCWQHSGL